MGNIDHNVKWLPQPNSVELIHTNILPNESLIASVFVFAFNEKRELLLIQEVGKETFDIPGGGVEKGENVFDAAKREVMEEAFTYVDQLEVVAINKLDVQGEKPENYRRPYPVSYVVYMKASVTGETPFIPNAETTSRRYFKLDKAFKQEGVLFGGRSQILKNITHSI